MTMHAPVSAAGVPAVLSVDPRTDLRWHDLVRGPRGSLFVSPPWITAVCGGFDLTPHARIAVDANGRTLGGFAWIEIDDINGRRLSSLPFSDRADPPLGDHATWELVSQDAFDALAAPMTVRCLSDAPPAHDRRMTIAGSAAWHYIDLDAALEDIRSRLQPAVRRNITSAQRNGIEVVVSSGIDAIRAYHRLHVWLRKHKYRMLAQPVEFFERIWNAFAPEDGVVTLLAHVDGKPVAGAVYLVWNDALYYKFGASLAEYLPMRPNEALHWTAIRWAVDRGLRLFDWGRSDLDQPGLMAYKSKWGSVESRIVLLRAGSDSQPARPGIGPVLGELTRLLTDDAVPDEVTARAGAILYRYFS